MTTADDAIPALADAIHRERVLRARRMPFEEKFSAGGRLFDSACEITKSGIRHDHPDWNETQVLNELRRRLERQRRREYRHLGQRRLS